MATFPLGCLSRPLWLALALSSAAGLACGEIRPPCRHEGQDGCPARGAPAAADGASSSPSSDGGQGSVWEVGGSGRAVVVSVDGLGAIYLRAELDRGDLPAFALLRRSSASTLNARTDYDYTATLPDHVSMLTGRPVAADPALPVDAYHGWTINSQVAYDVTLHNAGNPNLAYVASIFDVVHDHGGTTCLYSGKSKFQLIASSYNAEHGAPDRVGEDDGRNKLDRYVILEDTGQLIDTVEGDLQGGVCDVAFVHIADLDRIGHSDRWGSEAWLSALHRIDGWLARLLRFADPWQERAPFAFLLTADHGGFEGSHLDATDSRDYTIPFFVAGPGVAPNSDLYALVAPRRADPGLGRPRHSDPQQPVRNGDAANAALWLMGLPPVPGSYFRGLLGAQ